MRIDSQWTFIPITAPLSCVGATGATFASAVIDLLGQGVGTAPQGIIGTAALFGTDLGLSDGPGKPKLQCTTGAAFLTINSATLNLAIQLAPDTAVTFQPGTWQTVEETGALTAAQLTAAIVFARLDFPPVFPLTLRPRYCRLLATTPSGTQFTQGTIGFAGLTYVRDDYASEAQAARNYSVS